MLWIGFYALGVGGIGTIISLRATIFGEDTSALKQLFVFPKSLEGIRTIVPFFDLPKGNIIAIGLKILSCVLATVFSRIFLLLVSGAITIVVGGLTIDRKEKTRQKLSGFWYFLAIATVLGSVLFSLTIVLPYESGIVLSLDKASLLVHGELELTKPEMTMLLGVPISFLACMTMVMAAWICLIRYGSKRMNGFGAKLLTFILLLIYGAVLSYAMEPTICMLMCPAAAFGIKGVLIAIAVCAGCALLWILESIIQAIKPLLVVAVVMMHFIPGCLPFAIVLDIIVLANKFDDGEANDGMRSSYLYWNTDNMSTEELKYKRTELERDLDAYAPWTDKSIIRDKIEEELKKRNED